MYITKYNVHIDSSHLIHKKDMYQFVAKVKYWAGIQGSEVANRSLTSLLFEWYVHNLLYNLHIKRDRTGSVDFNYPLSIKEKIFYYILGPIAFLLIK